MLRLQIFTFNPFQENTYLIIDEQNQCWIVDPGMYNEVEKNQLFQYIDNNNLIPKAIINTHTHIDHIFGVQACKKRYQIPFLIHRLDLPVLNGAKSSAMMFGFDFSETPTPDEYFQEGSKIELGKHVVSILLVPGHSPGSVAFYHKESGWIIGGDVLFQGSIGRTDLPGGNFETLISSIEKQFFSLHDETIVYSGHGPSTTIGFEKKHNPFLQ
ncbi:MAG: MBL fold metallo-hydrolase [Bacteroidetes bacterium]|nr:MBL fold metallo-hydrolase [Bacteroidota bacterium]